MAQQSAYRELPPPPGLRRALSCLWIRTVGDEDGASVRVLPDGCVDLIWQRGRGAFLAGPDTAANLSPTFPDSIFVGVRFRPSAGPPAPGLRLDSLRDQRIAAARFDSRLARTLDPELSPRAAVDWLIAITTGMVGAGPPDHAVGEAARRLASPGTRVAPLARELGLSERQLRRRCQSTVGYGPKTLQRVLRFQRFLSLLTAPGPAPELAELAFDAGYADQAHLTRECAALAGLTPTVLAAAWGPDATPTAEPRAAPRAAA